MKTILLIIKREFIVRVRKKSFLIMSLAGPIGMALLMVVPYWFSSESADNRFKEVYLTAPKDYTKELNSLQTNYHFIEGKAETAEEGITIRWTNILAPKLDFTGSKKDYKLITLLRLFALNKANTARLSKNGIPVQLTEIETSFHFSQSEKSKGYTIKMFISYISGFVIYFFIFLYGIQVMKGIIEEKNNKIIEVVLTTVKPYQLMLGKIFGLGAVGFTQFMIWVTSVLLVTQLFSSVYEIERFGEADVIALFEQKNAVNLDFVMEMNTLVITFQEMNLIGLLGSFILFFIIGYLIFASLFAIVGAASDIDTDTQQFIFPITVPLISSMALIQPVIENPDSTLANVLSYLPFSASIITSARFPFHDEINYWPLKWGLSALVAIAGFLFLVWVAAKIYRIGILNYGQKVGYGTLWKWIKQKD